MNEQSPTGADDDLFFLTVRVAAHRDGDHTTPFARIQNLARVRVVVSRDTFAVPVGAH